MKKNKFVWAGFTLVELLLSIAIIMLLAGVGAVSINNFNARQKVNSAKDDLITNLKLARNYATTMQMPSGLSGTLKEVQVDIVNTKITVYGVNGQDNKQIYFSKDIFPEEVGVTKVSPVSAVIKFSSYKGSSIGATGDIEIVLSTDADVDNFGVSMGTTSVVVIKSSGLINEK